ncbi:hypothetical protein FOXG_21783 [Fusarium oxysporum f. sp. lycopersici 4287]|uniref:Uncharacterized protein n=1 Tax=Fusarium oxysporum f. sp. lycopersici (strain 4287 / CBS 123668 / FGSC 9935 / NRRL 34936) TaxID=426428 RepID=A0A0J9W1E5_FUSO4|nr:hypothetical protein FOXG_21783 [Fusarium oxysporum f. sp. lycopersici 4287]KNB16751.1 hypothetical protein FOXG_21783 [Fusarium oxysporum f. sp. lycopersici 4287]
MGLPSDQHVFPDPKVIINGVIVVNTYCDWLRTRRMIQAISISSQAVGLEIAIRFNSSEKEIKRRTKAILKNQVPSLPYIETMSLSYARVVHPACHLQFKYQSSSLS